MKLTTILFAFVMVCCISVAAIGFFSGRAFRASSNMQSPATPGITPINPLTYPGSDLGQKINNVLAGGGNCAEIRIPPGVFVYSTTIRIWKPCQTVSGSGSALTTLEYTGSGDAIVWQMEPFSIQKAGVLSGFTLKGPGEKVGNGIRSGTVVGATFEDLVINNFRGPKSAAILFENTRSGGMVNGMAAWTERTVMRDVHLGIPHIGNSVALAFVVNGGTPSFGYTDISDVWMNVEKGQTGVKWGKNSYTYNSKLIFHANISAIGDDSFVILGIIRNSVLILTGEAGCAKNLVHLGPEAEVQAQGFISVNCGTVNSTRGYYERTDLAGVQVDNPRWDAFQLSPLYAPLVNGKGLLLLQDLERRGETDFTNYYGPEPKGSAGGFNFYNTYSSLDAPNRDPGALVASISDRGDWKTRGSASWGGGAPIPSSDRLALKEELPLTGRTGAIGGEVKAGSCLTGSAKVAGAKIGQVVPHPNAADGSLDNPVEIVSGSVTAADTVSVQRCALAATRLPVKSYNVRVIR